jgi:hypothetical protein
LLAFIHGLYLILISATGQKIMCLNEVNLKQNEIDRYIEYGKVNVPFVVQQAFYHIQDTSLIRSCFGQNLGTYDTLRLCPHVMQ